MRLPWLQLTGEGKRRAKSFGLLLGIGAHAGVGFVSDLWEAALDLSPEGDFSGKVEDAALLVAHAGGFPPGCAPDPARVVQCLQQVGLVATSPCLRVRGLDRYRVTWSKNRRSQKRPGGTRGEPGAQDEEKEKDVDQDRSEDDLREQPPSSKPRSPSEALQLFDDLEFWRQERCTEDGIEPKLSKRPPPAKLNAMVARLWQFVHPDAPDQPRIDHVAQIFKCYLAEEFGRVDDRKGGAERSPPWPIELFLTPNVFERYARDYENGRLDPWRPAEVLRKKELDA